MSNMINRSSFLLLSLNVMASPAIAQEIEDRIIWTNSQFNDDQNQGRMTSSISIGVPETDISLGFARCFAGSTAGLPILAFGADISNRADGDPMNIDFFTDAGALKYPGEAVAALSEEDSSKIQISLGFNDPLWEIMRRSNNLRYRLGRDEVNVPLRGSSKAIARFLSDCRNYHPETANAEDEAAGVRVSKKPPARENGNGIRVVKAEVTDPRWETCDTLKNEVSRVSDRPVTVTFKNLSEGYRAVYWIGFDGQPKDYAGLNSGEEFTINTYLTHPWMFTDGPGNCLEMYMPQLGVSVFNITAPNRDFGPE